MAKPTASAKQVDASVDVLQIATETIVMHVLGRTPLVCNRVSEKAKRELLMPRGRKSAADKASTLKHDPLEEYRASVYRSPGEDSPTRIMMPAISFKSALRSVATDMPGMAKAQIGRLTYVDADYVNIFGVPKAFLSIVRQADMNRTPDVRSRAILPEWACTVEITFVKPLLRARSVVDLFAAAGIMRGVGDFRPEKGAGRYGQFELVSADDERWASIVASGGRDVQDDSLTDPEPYDLESAELLTWFTAETERRGFKVVG